MNSDFLIRLETAFTEAAALADQEKQTLFLANLAESDAELERELRALLTIREDSEGLIESREGEYASLLTTTMRTMKRIEKVDEFLGFLEQMSGPVEGSEIALVRGFYLSNLIATGPTGFVFHGRDPQLCRDVAIKFLAPSIARVTEQKKLFIDEARLASVVLHDNVVSIHHISAEPDSPLVFYAMEWINGPTLQEWLEYQTQPELHRDHAMSLFRQLADGLAEIHDHGIVHRDLKPANVMLDASEKHLKIVDFGIAFEATKALELSEPVGTPLYMSPEQLQGGSATQASDIFSLAEIACVLIWTKHPFAENSVDRLVERVMTGTPDLPPLEVGCGPAAQAVLRKALSTDPNLRFSTATEFAAELLAAMKSNHDCAAPDDQIAGSRSERNGASQADSASRVLEAAHWLAPARQRRWLFALVGLAAVLLVIGVANLPVWLTVDSVWSGEDSVWSGEDSGSQRGGSNSAGPNAPDLASKAEGVAAGKWENPDLFLNFMGMQLKRIPALGQSIKAWPPDPEHPDLFRALGWENMAGDRWIASKLVTRRQYLKVMGLSEQLGAEPTLSLDTPITNVSYHDVETFCERLTDLDPDGIRYRVIGKNLWTMATYGYRMIAENRRAESLLDTFRRLSRGEAIEDQAQGTTPLIDDVFGSTWEWVNGATVKPVALDGVVSYRKRPEIPSEQFFEVLGGGQNDLFVHSHDMNFGMNDHFHGSDNLRFHLESDEETCYLMPESVGEKSWLSYRYRFEKQVRSASVRNPIKLYQENAVAGIRIRCTERSIEKPVEDCQWHTVLVMEGPMPNPSLEPIDLTPIVKGAVEIEIEYWVEAVTPPLWEVQLGRTNTTLGLTSLFGFQAVTGGREQSMRQSVTVPTSFRSPFIGFRVGAVIDDRLREDITE